MKNDFFDVGGAAPGVCEICGVTNPMGGAEPRAIIHEGKLDYVLRAPRCARTLTGPKCPSGGNRIMSEWAKELLQANFI